MKGIKLAKCWIDIWASWYHSLILWRNCLIFCSWIYRPLYYTLNCQGRVADYRLSSVRNNLELELPTESGVGVLLF